MTVFTLGTLAVLLGALLVLNALFVLYVFSMNVQRVRDNGWMTGWHWFFAGPWVIVAILLDVVLNYGLLALLTLDFPQTGERTFSNRLSRLVRDPGWRGKQARAIAYILDPFDPSGKHIL